MKGLLPIWWRSILQLMGPFQPFQNVQSMNQWDEFHLLMVLLISHKKNIFFIPILICKPALYASIKLIYWQWKFELRFYICCVVGVYIRQGFSCFNSNVAAGVCQSREQPSVLCPLMGRTVAPTDHHCASAPPPFYWCLTAKETRSERLWIGSNNDLKWQWRRDELCNTELCQRDPNPS